MKKHWKIVPYTGADKVIRIIGPNNFYPGQHVALVMHDDHDLDQQEAHARNIVGHMNGQLCGAHVVCKKCSKDLSGRDWFCSDCTERPDLQGKIVVDLKELEEGDTMTLKADDGETWYLTKKEPKP